MINKANNSVVIVTSIAAFVLVFSLVATKTLIGQAAYQNRVLGAKHQAVRQLKSDIAATAQLKAAYNAFTSTPQNVLGGNPAGNGPQDGNDAKIVLDALPSSYDFPALATSLEKLVSSQNLQISSIAGTDDQIAQSANQTSANPQPVPMPFQLSVTGNYQSLQGLINVFEASIRPMQIQTLDISGSQTGLTMNLTAQTYYQPATSFNITTKVVK